MIGCGYCTVCWIRLEVHSSGPVPCMADWKRTDVPSVFAGTGIRKGYVAIEVEGAICSADDFGLCYSVDGEGSAIAEEFIENCFT